MFTSRTLESSADHSDPPRECRLIRFADRIHNAGKAVHEFMVGLLADAFADKEGFALRDCFAEDAVWHVPGGGIMSGTYRGRSEIFRFLAALPKQTNGTYRSTWALPASCSSALIMRRAKASSSASPAASARPVRPIRCT